MIGSQILGTPEGHFRLAPTFAACWEEARVIVENGAASDVSPARMRLLLAALEACNGRSIASVSARDIAGKAGIRAASLYSHYPSKVELLAAAFTWSYTRFLERLVGQVAPGMDGDSLLSGLIRAHLEHDAQFRESGLLWRDSPDLETSRDPTVMELRARVFYLPQLYRRIVATILVENGVADLLRPKAAITVRILNDVDSWYEDPVQLPLDEAEQQCRRLIGAMIGA